MDVQPEKIYVAVEKDMKEGLGTLEWALRNWSSQSISLVLLHVSNSSKDFVQTPFGKFPASSINDEKLEFYRMQEKEKTDKMLKKYEALCGKVKVEILHKENSDDEPIHKVIVELITTHHVKKLVMGIAFTKSSSRKAKSGISGSFYVHKHKPNFCELFIICGEKLVLLREENNEGYIGNEEGAMVVDMRKKMKEKGSIRGWIIGRILPDSAAINVASSSERGNDCHEGTSSMGRDTCDMKDKWNNCAEEIEAYFQLLSNSNSNEEDNGEEVGSLEHSPIDQAELELTNPNMNVPEKIETLKAKIEEAHKTTTEKRNEAKANVERRSRAERVLSVCNQRAEELEGHLNKELANQNDLNKSLDNVREQLEEVSNDITQSKNKLRSASELESELMNILKAHSFEKSHIEAQLQKAVITRASVLRDIDEMRRQRDVLRRRVEFCRERVVATRTDSGLSYREFTVNEVREATDNFSEHLRVVVGEIWKVYRGRINHTIVAIKVQNSSNMLAEEFQAKMELLCQIRHPNIIGVIGACTELRCIVVEYMHNGSLHDFFFSNQNPRTPLLPWQARVRIATEICMGLGFLHATQPRPTSHGRLSPSNVLLDRNLVAKISDFCLDQCSNDDMILGSDISALGIIILQLIAGPMAGVVERVKLAMKRGVLVDVLDETAGEWPAEVAGEFARIGVRCAEVGKMTTMDLTVAMVMREMEELSKMSVAKGRGGGGEEVVVVGRDRHGEGESFDVPSIFICPIFQEVMEQPHVAADGFSYELEAIEEWLGSGHDTSPMTNLKLKHNRLTPNHTLRSLIQDWRNRSRP
ncbi:U-box domain-containing protein kinase family protein isoform X2 [Tasmannia lanceolata]|uniref:U-box domain-containing protein kinase family protein isoform X2 n=1 Tax=Tasmannia lanceolata TaxID=3420 RepID=UPI0040633372